MVSLWMDIISAMDRSAKDRFSWKLRRRHCWILLENSCYIWAVKILFIQENSRISRAKLSVNLCGPPPPVFLRKIGVDDRHFGGEYRQMFVWASWMNFAAQIEASCAQINGVWGQIFVGWILPFHMQQLCVGNKLTCLAVLLQPVLLPTGEGARWCIWCPPHTSCLLPSRGKGAANALMLVLHPPTCGLDWPPICAG